MGPQDCLCLASGHRYITGVTFVSLTPSNAFREKAFRSHPQLNLASRTKKGTTTYSFFFERRLAITKKIRTLLVILRSLLV